jgi:hypothetical protein
LQNIKVEAFGGDHISFTSRKRDASEAEAPDPRIGPLLPDQPTGTGVAPVKSVLTMSFIIGPLSGALVAGGVWPLIVYHILRAVFPDRILDLLWLF